MGESYMYQRLPYARGEEEGEDEDEEERDGRMRESVGGQMVKSEVVGGLWLITVCLCGDAVLCVGCLRFHLNIIFRL